MKVRRGEAGFTLVELLVASAITALVVSLLSAATFQFLKVTDRGHDRLSVLRDHRTAFQWLNRDAQMAVSELATVGPSSVTLQWTDVVSGTTYQSSYAQSGDELVRTLTVNGAPSSQTVARNLAPSGFSASKSGDLLTVSITSAKDGVTQTRTETIYMRVLAVTATPFATPASTATPTPTPATCDLAVTDGPNFGGGGKHVKFAITNNAASSAATLESISVSWDSGYGNLKKIKFGGPTVWSGNEAPPSASIGSLTGDLVAGDTEELRFEFASDGDEANVTFTATFSGGCTVGN